jgi:hypothetical protein
MKKSLVFIFATVIIVVVAVSAFAAIETYHFDDGAGKKPFYVGVTYGGDSTTEAQQLIDRVKTYTNLFVITSDSLQYNLTAMEQVCEYAVNSGLNVIVHFGAYDTQLNATATFLNEAKSRWGTHFLGLYYIDEPGGKMLDSFNPLGNNITKSQFGVSISQRNGSIMTSMSFDFSGKITLSYIDFESGNDTMTVYYTNGTITIYSKNELLTYLPNGTVTMQKDEPSYVVQTFIYTNGTTANQLNNEPPMYIPNATVVTDRGNISQFEPYQKLWNSRPLQTYDEVAAAYEDGQQATISWVHNQTSTNVLTSDYGLYWFDYKATYDVVLAQLGWNDNPAQELALARGAADMQNKSWGSMITWTTSAYPSLPSGDKMYNELKLAYEDGAKYAVVFNYAPGDNGTGLLTNEHFAALKNFWTNVAQNPRETNNVTAQDSLVLPRNYGWGMRNQNDTIWGMWQPDAKSQQVWVAVQGSLSKYGSKLDIIYDDASFPVADKYAHVYYWNQTG